MIDSIDEIVSYIFYSMNRKQAMRSLRKAKISAVIQANLELASREETLLRVGYIENTLGLSKVDGENFTTLYQALADENSRSDDEDIHRLLVCFAVSEDSHNISRDGLLDSIREYEQYLCDAGISSGIFYKYFAQEIMN